MRDERSKTRGQRERVCICVGFGEERWNSRKKEMIFSNSATNRPGRRDPCFFDDDEKDEVDEVGYASKRRRANSNRNKKNTKCAHTHTHTRAFTLSNKAHQPPPPRFLSLVIRLYFNKSLITPAPYHCHPL